jgi:uncharacterized membrane protein YdjX (TVP38/TMEM64 family)
MRELLRPMMFMSLVLAVPILPFLIFGAQLNEWIDQWKDEPRAAPITAAVIVGLLASDIFLPVPSSVLSTMSGWRLGWWLGTIVSWIGMNLGAVIGFALARKWGAPFAAWFSKPDQLRRMQELSSRLGPAALIVSRGVPVLAEASVLLMGMHGLTWRRFLPPVLLANLGLSLAYAAFGDFAEQHHWLPLALGVSIALPVLLATIVRGWMPK